MAETRPNEQADDSVKDMAQAAESHGDAHGTDQAFKVEENLDQSKVQEVKPAVKASKKPSSRNVSDLAEVPAGRTNFFDLEYNIAAALCYFPILPILVSVLWLKTELNINQYLKWHCIQGIIFGGGFLVISVLMGTVEAIFGFIPLIGPIIALILSLVRALMAVLFTVFCVKQMVNVYKGKPGKLPFAAKLTDQFMQAGQV